MSFLTAEWRKLVFANYVIDKDVLKTYLPYGTELDLWNGNCYVSLIGFMFVYTNLLGIKIPFHINFEEVNLRFYVRHLQNGEWKRGVVFIKEIVPKRALTFVANTIYKENYETMPMNHHWHANDKYRTIQYRWKKGNKWNLIQVQAGLEALTIEPDSETEFITEHYWGYARVNGGQTNEYQVTHPKWLVYEVQEFAIDVAFGEVYGPTFNFLNTLQPTSVMLADGSNITIENKRIIKSDPRVTL
jgi:uncharacterized protein YqjF (DUF2071 family)